MFRNVLLTSAEVQGTDMSNFSRSENQDTNTCTVFGFQLEKPFVKTARVYPIPLATHRPEKATQCQTAAWGKKRKVQPI